MKKPKLNTDCFEKRLPWLAIKSVEVMEKYLNKDSVVFEYGIGGSTLWFADRVKAVHCVDNDKLWINKVSNALKKDGKKNVVINYKLLGPDSGYPIHKASELYVNTIAISGLKYDLILIDGRERVQCVKAALNYIKEDGLLVCDNFERERYEEARTLLKTSGWTWDYYRMGRTSKLTYMYRRRKDD